MAIGAILGGVTGLISAIMQAQAQAQANEINRQSLNETKRKNKKQERLLEAPKQDAYGNVLRYTPGVGFRNDLTGLTKAILEAQQVEQRSQLQEDAPRNRAAAERQDRRSQAAGESFEELFNEYRYRDRPSREAEQSKAKRKLLETRRRGLDEAANDLMRGLLRTGNSSNIAGAFNAADDAYVNSLEEVLLRGEQLGSANFDEKLSANPERKELDFLRSIADNTTTSPVTFSDFPQRADARQDNAVASLASAIRQGQQAASADAGRYSSGVARSAPDLSALASALSKISFEGGNKRQPETSYGLITDLDEKYDPWYGLRTASI